MQCNRFFADASPVLKFIPFRTSRAMQRSFTLTLLLLSLPACLLCSAVARAEEQIPMAPTVRVSPWVGPPTTYVRVSGSGFAPNQCLDILFDETKMGDTCTDGSGAFNGYSMSVPRGAHPGTHLVTAAKEAEKASAAFLVRTDWAQFRFNSTHTGMNPYENTLGPNNVGKLVLKWHYQTGAAVSSSPAVANGIVYVGSQDRNLYALSATKKTLLWKYPTASYITSSPAVVNGAVYFSDGTNMYALNAATGVLLWKKSTGVENHCGSPTVFKGVWYWVGSGYGISSHVFATDVNNGNLLWSRYIGIPNDSSAYCSSAAVATSAEYPHEDWVYVGAWDGNLYVLNAKTGQRRWEYRTGGRIRSSPVVDGIWVYFGSDDFNLYALNAITGQLLWKYRTGGRISSSPAVDSGLEELVYVGSEDGNVYALSLDRHSGGKLVWKYPTEGYVVSSPATANRVVYVGSENRVGDLFAFDPTGEPLWSFSTMSSIVSSPAIADGVVYVGLDNGNIYAFGLPSNSQQQVE